jgi:hypothetical protein
MDRLNEQAAQAAQTAQTAQETGLDDLRRVIDVMVPPITVEVVDVFGNQYTLAGVVAARVQIQILRLVEGLASLPAGALFAGADATAGGALKLLTGLAHEPKVLESLAAAFQIAHPRAVEQAMEDARSAGLDPKDAADLFAVEEIVAGLVPLFVRLVKRGTLAATALGVRGAAPARG